MDTVNPGPVERSTTTAMDGAGGLNDKGRSILGALDAGGGLPGTTEARSARSAGDCILYPDRIPAHVMITQGPPDKRRVRFLDMKVREYTNKRRELYETMLREIAQDPNKGATSSVQNSETEQTFAKLGSKGKHQLDQPPTSANVDENGTSKQIIVRTGL